MNNKTRTKQVSTRSKRRSTEAEFNSVIPFLSISKDRINAAKKVIVDGKTLQTVADEYRLSRQSIDGSVTAVWSTIQKYREAQSATLNDGLIMPPGWEQVTLVAPRRLIDKFRLEIATEFLNQDNK
ncbi:MAG TPA: TrfB-related DNA-binding protein [Candidatus Saccharimonadales bacterium]